ncbi:MAG: SpoIIE family protein phosphatase [Chlamydiota bacterium]
MNVLQALATSPFSKDYPITVLLVDDQPIIGQAVGEMLEGEDDIVFHYCKDPTKAISMADDIKPTVILQDLLMPEIDGLTLLRYFRANSATEEVPMIVLSSKEDPEVKAQAFELGANDYIVKLPDKIELLARIRYHSMAYINHLQRNEAYDKLQRNQEILINELSEAAQYVTSLLPEPLKGEVSAEWVFIPSTQLGGDSFGYQWVDDDNFIVYLLDVCGHGVGSALLSISAMDSINSRSLPGVNFLEPAEVLKSLNKHYPMEEHGDKFFTMWYGVYNKKTRTLKYSSGGHPPMALLTGPNADEAELVLLKTPGMLVGISADAEYHTDSCKVGDYGKLTIFSDGAYELEASQGHRINIQEFVEVLEQQPRAEGKAIDYLLDWARKAQGKENFEDDYSVVEVHFH